MTRSRRVQAGTIVRVDARPSRRIAIGTDERPDRRKELPAVFVPLMLSAAVLVSRRRR